MIIDGETTAEALRERIAAAAGGITPVPGGVGPMTIACLLQNTLVACAYQNGINLSAIG